MSVRNEIDNFPILFEPFGASDKRRTYDMVKGGEGITHEMTVPIANGGTPFTRHNMNGFGYYATLGTYLIQRGYPMGIWRQEYAEKIGGYPQGAILAYVDENGYVVEYESKVDNNLESFPSLAAGAMEENDFWRPLTYTTTYLGVPNYSNLIESISNTFWESDMSRGIELRLTLSQDAYVKVSREISEYYDVVKTLDAINQYDCQIYQESNGVATLLTTIVTATGQSASVCLPMAKDTTVLVKMDPVTISAVNYRLDMAIEAFGIMGAVS